MKWKKTLSFYTIERNRDKSFIKLGTRETERKGSLAKKGHEKEQRLVSKPTLSGSSIKTLRGA